MGGNYSYCLEMKNVLGTNLKYGWLPVFVTWNQHKYRVLNLGGGGTTYLLVKSRVSTLWSGILSR